MKDDNPMKLHPEDYLFPERTSYDVENCNDCIWYFDCESPLDGCEDFCPAYEIADTYIEEKRFEFREEWFEMMEENDEYEL